MMVLMLVTACVHSLKPTFTGQIIAMAQRLVLHGVEKRKCKPCTLRAFIILFRINNRTREHKEAAISLSPLTCVCSPVVFYALFCTVLSGPVQSCHMRNAPDTIQVMVFFNGMCHISNYRTMIHWVLDISRHQPAHTLYPSMHKLLFDQDFLVD